MNSHLRRLPNECCFINNYHGNVIGLKMLLYIISLIYENGEIHEDFIIPYKNFGSISNTLRTKGREYICKYIVETININLSWFTQYANVNFDEKYVYIRFSEKMVELCRFKEGNFYLYDIDVISSFTNANAIKLYLIYKRHGFMTVMNGKNVFKCNNEHFCSIFQDCQSYTAIRHAIKTAIKDFTRVTEIPVEVMKRDNIWKVIYDDIVMYKQYKRSKLPDIDDYDEDELEDI
jgi:hypothetical protein